MIQGHFGTKRMKKVLKTLKKETLNKEFGLRTQAEEYPMMLVLSFAYPCNALCPHCPYTNSNIRKEYKDAPYMHKEVFKKIADESGPYNAYLRISGGGEPMLHPEATGLLVYAKKVGCKIGLITNGSKFNDTNLKQLIDAEVDLIEFSVDADNPKDYSIYRKGLDWNVLLENVKKAIRYRNSIRGKSKIIVSAVNQVGVDIDRIEDFWVNKIGADYIIKRKFLTWGNNTEMDNSKSADKSEYIDVEQTPCPFIFERLNIDSRGNIMVCGYDISANTSMGNVLTDTIKSIWKGKGFEFYRNMHLSNKGSEITICKNCPDWKYRSWNHNYWKVVKNAEMNRYEKIKNLDENDDFQSTKS